MKSIIAALALLSCSWSAFAQTDASPEYREFEVSAFFGPSFGADFEFPTPVTGSNQQTSRTVGMSQDSGYMLGARVSQNVGEFWGADFEYTFANQRLRFTNVSPTIQTLSMNQYIHRISYNVLSLFTPRTKRFRPFAELGFGVVGFCLPSQARKVAMEQGLELRDSWKVAINAGGGFKYLVKDQFALTFDVKDRMSQVPAYRLPSSASVVNGQYRPGMAAHGVLNNWQLSFGFNFQWDEAF